ncbi:MULTISPECIES: phosphopantetheine-binding protein [unclassified Streptomyces]|uniref:phosphopantetheine-binding protein n=1 Tax=unclassified Streptomyces TaxID=2593676 RepID=UPI002DD9977A|nr:phosphopantetheine-binding protein [Streptomyces sp. NBC_01750]WSA98228.1 phosphopantetheine-binding protein [Streptomyces sp. NBC_01794]WSD37235.1 phosphopantetheine-binding protein [Streptomyces sp. NBC_01750]
MERMELSDLITLLRECAGESESVNLDGDIMDVLFLDLDYDSLAILQTTGRIERDYEITLDEEAIDAAETPRQYLALVNRVLATRAVV